MSMSLFFDTLLRITNENYLYQGMVKKRYATDRKIVITYKKQDNPSIFSQNQSQPVHSIFLIYQAKL